MDDRKQQDNRSEKNQGTLGKDRNAGYTDGDDSRRPAKFGRPRNGNDADAAYAAQLANNADPVYEEVDGRCSHDGLPVGNCAHFPGEQLVVPGPGEDPYASGGTVTREDGSRSRTGVPPVGVPDSNDEQAAKDQRGTKEKAAREDGNKL